MVEYGVLQWDGLAVGVAFSRVFMRRVASERFYRVAVLTRLTADRDDGPSRLVPDRHFDVEPCSRLVAWRENKRQGFPRGALDDAPPLPSEWPLLQACDHAILSLDEHPTLEAAARACGCSGALWRILYPGSSPVIECSRHRPRGRLFSGAHAERLLRAPLSCTRGAPTP